MKRFSIVLAGFVLFAACCLLVACTSKSGQNTDPYIKKMQKNGGEVFTKRTMGNKPLRGSPYGCEMWTEGGIDNRLIWYGSKFGGGAAFRAEWNNPNDFLGRVGYFWNQGKPYTNYGNIFCDFEFTRSDNGTGGRYSYIGIYGWSKNPLVEWYIVDDWYGNGIMGPSTMGGGATKKGEITVDGAVYFVYEAKRVNKPSIDGNATFPQFFSIRQERRQSGTISVTEHFKEWEKLGMNLGGNMYEAKFLVEAGSGSGWFDASYLSLRQE